MDAPSWQIDTDHDLGSIWVSGRNSGRLREVQLVIKCFLHTITSDMLAEIALWIQKSHTNKRQAKITCFFAVIPGKNPQTTGINRERFMQTKFCGEIRSDPVDQFRVGACEPGILLGSGAYSNRSRSGRYHRLEGSHPAAQLLRDVLGVPRSGNERDYAPHGPIHRNQEYGRAHELRDASSTINCMQAHTIG